MFSLSRNDSNSKKTDADDLSFDSFGQVDSLDQAYTSLREPKQNKYTSKLLSFLMSTVDNSCETVARIVFLVSEVNDPKFISLPIKVNH